MQDNIDRSCKLKQLEDNVSSSEKKLNQFEDRLGAKDRVKNNIDAKSTHLQVKHHALMMMIFSRKHHNLKLKLKIIGLEKRLRGWKPKSTK